MDGPITMDVEIHIAFPVKCRPKLGFETIMF